MGAASSEDAVRSSPSAAPRARFISGLNGQGVNHGRPHVRLTGFQHADQGFGLCLQSGAGILSRARNVRCGRPLPRHGLQRGPRPLLRRPLGPSLGAIRPRSPRLCRAPARPRAGAGFSNSWRLRSWVSSSPVRRCRRLFRLSTCRARAPALASSAATRSVSSSSSASCEATAWVAALYLRVRLGTDAACSSPCTASSVLRSSLKRLRAASAS